MDKGNVLDPLLPIVRKVGYCHNQDYPIDMAEKQARLRAKPLARSLKAQTADNIMKSCAPASAGPEGQPAKSCIKPSTKDTPIVAPATPGQWIIDSGSAFDIVSRSDLTAPQRKQMTFDGSVSMQTAGGETRALGTVNLVDPFGRPIEAHVLKDSPSLISLGRLCGEEGFSFAGSRAKSRS